LASSPLSHQLGAQSLQSELDTEKKKDKKITKVARYSDCEIIADERIYCRVKETTKMTENGAPLLIIYSI
jgi:hypothetical protein